MEFHRYYAETGILQFWLWLENNRMNKFNAVGRLLTVGVKDEGEFFPLIGNSLHGRKYITGDIEREDSHVANAYASASGIRRNLLHHITKQPLFTIEYFVLDTGQVIHLDEKGMVVAAPRQVVDNVA